MAKTKTPLPVAAQQYAAAPDDLPVSESPANVAVIDEDFSAIQEIAANASYLLLDIRDNEWQLMAFGAMGGANLRSFPDVDSGIAFVKAANITNCRCLFSGGGVIR
jgi:hypothetical protein